MQPLAGSGSWPLLGDAPAYGHDLEQWFTGLSARIPGTSVDKELLPFGFVRLETSGLVCSGFDVKGVDVSELPHTATSRSARLWVYNASAQHCGGDWRVRRAEKTLLSGAFSFRISKLMLDLPLLFDSSRPSRPISVLRKGCKTSVRMQDLRFGQKMGILRKIFFRLIQGSLNLFVGTFGCHLSRRALAPANALVAPWLSPPEPPQPLPAELPTQRTAQLVNWSRDVPLLKAIPDGLHGAAGIRWMVAKMTAGTDRLALDASTESFPSLSLGRRASERLGLQVSARLTNISVAGLGTVTKCQALAAVGSEPHSLRTSCVLDALNVSGALSIEVAPLEEAPASASFNASSRFSMNVTAAVALQHVQMELQMLVAADRSRLDKLTVDGLMWMPSLQALGTVAAATYALNVTELDARIARIKEVTFAQDGGPLAAALASSFGALSRAFLGAENFQNVLPNAFAQEVYPRLRQTLNERSAQGLAFLSRFADPDGGAMHPHATDGIDPPHIRNMALCAACIFLPLGLLAYAASRLCAKRRAARAEALGGGPTERQGGTAAAPAGAGGADVLSDASSTCMKWALPCFIVANMALGFWSVLVPVCDVRAKAVGGLIDPTKPIADDSLLVYSFSELLSDFMNAGARISGCLLAIGCVVVPQLSGLLMLVAFGLPMRPRLRGFLCLFFLFAVRQVGINQFFLSLVVCTLRAQVSVSGMTTDVTAEPVYGLATATLATFGALLLAGLLYHLHTKSAPGTTAAGGAAAAGAEWQVSRRTARLALLGAMAASLTFGGACAGKILSLELTGLAGDVESSGVSTTPAAKEIWLLSLPGRLYSSTDEKVIAAMIGFLLAMLSIVAPVLCCAAWLVQWGWVVVTGKLPHSSALRVVRACAHASPYLYGWCATDIIWASAAAGCLEMDLAVQFIAMKKAGPLCTLLEHRMGLPCVHVEGRLEVAGWFLLASVLLSFALFVCTTVAFASRPRPNASHACEALEQQS